MDTNTFAKKVHGEPKKVRKFLREIVPVENQPGRGRRWVLPDKGTELQRLNRQYKKWATAHTRTS